MIAAADRPGLAQFVSRVLRLDPTAVVRLRPEPDGPGSAWAMLPFRVLVARRLSQPLPADVTVRAADLATALTDGAVGDLVRRDEAWRWPVPTSAGRTVEHIPVAEVRRLAAAAARTLRQALTEGVNGRAVGERVLRDALLDHVAIVVTGDDGERIEIPQRMVQALVRTGLLDATPATAGVGAQSVMADTVGTVVSASTESIDAVAVRRTMTWIGLSSRYGSAWYRPISPLRMSRGVDG